MTSARRAGFAGLLIAETISIAGTRMSQLAVPWLVLTSTHDPVSTGLVVTAEIAPYVVLQVLGAPLVDRLGGRRVAITGNVAAGLAMLAIPLLWHSGWHGLAPVLILIFLAGVARGPADPATQVLLPAVTARAGISIDRSTALFEGAARLASLLGAPIGALLIGGIGAANVVAVDATTFFIAALLVVALVPVSAGATADSLAESGQTQSGYLADLAEGFRFLRRHKLLRSIAGMVFFTNLADAAMSGLLVLLWAEQHYGSAGRLGVVAAAFGVGAVTGTTVLAAFGPRLPRRWTFAGAFLLAGAPRFLVLAAPVPFTAVLAVWAVSGLAAGAINPLLSAAEYDAVPRQLQARVLSTVGALSWAGIPFGALLAGALVQATSLTTALMTGAALYLAATLDPFLRPSWALMDRPAVGMTAQDSGATPMDGHG